MKGHDLIAARVEALKAELPGISFGYIGNVYTQRGLGQVDDRSWRVFLPSAGPGPLRSYVDMFYIGSTELMSSITEERWAVEEPKLRKLYHSAPRVLRHV